MRRITLLALTPFLLAVAACGDDDSGGSTEAFCEQAEELGDFGGSIAPDDPNALEDGANRIEALAVDAPEEIADELDTLASAISSFASNLAGADPSDPQAQLDAVSSLFTDVSGEELDEALGAVQEFGQRECGIDPTTTDPSFAELQDQIGASGESPGDDGAANDGSGDDGSGDDGSGDDGSDIPEDLPAPGPRPDTDDPEMEPLIDACEAGDMGACDDLFDLSEIGSDAEAYGDTCGARVDDDQDKTCEALFA